MVASAAASHGTEDSGLRKVGLTHPLGPRARSWWRRPQPRTARRTPASERWVLRTRSVPGPAHGGVGRSLARHGGLRPPKGGSYAPARSPGPLMVASAAASHGTEDSGLRKV